MYRAPSRHRVRILALAMIAGLLIAACTNDSPAPLAPPTPTDSQATSEPSQADPNPADANETETPDAPPDETTAVVDEADPAPNDAPPVDTASDERPTQPPAADATPIQRKSRSKTPGPAVVAICSSNSPTPPTSNCWRSSARTVGERRGLELLQAVPSISSVVPTWSPTSTPSSTSPTSKRRSSRRRPTVCSESSAPTSIT